MAWKWWKPKDDPLKNKYVHKLEQSLNAIEEETDQQETSFSELDNTRKRSVLLSFLNIGETLKEIEHEDELNTDELPSDPSRKWRHLRNRIAHEPLEVQDSAEYVDEHLDQLDGLNDQVNAYWLERVKRRKGLLDRDDP